MSPRQSNLLLVGIVAGIVAAFAGVALFGRGMTAVAVLGDLFLTALRMVVVPLVFCSLVAGIAGLGDVRRLGKVGGITLAYFTANTGAAVLLGLVLVNVLRPGAGSEAQANTVEAVQALRAIAAAQEEYKARGTTDANGDGQGEYGFLGNLLDAGNGPAALALAGFEASPDPWGAEARDRRGYRFEVVLPGEGDWVASGLLRADFPVATARAQHQFAALARPIRPGETGTHGFFINQRGKPYLVPPESSSGIPGLHAFVFRPGPPLPPGVDLPDDKRARIGQQRTLGLREILLSFVSPNIVKSLAEMDVLPIILFALVFGALATTIGEAGRPVIAFFQGANAIVMKIVGLIMWFAPVGVFGLVAAKFGGATDLGAELARVGRYVGTVVTGLAIHGAVTLPLALWLLGGRNPLAFVLGMGRALLTAFSTASSSATLPVTTQCAIEGNRVPARAVQFVLPLGATVNMSGTALYEAVAASFIAQSYGITFSLGEQVLVFVTATLAAVGAAGIPEAGLFTMVLVLRAVGLPLEGIALLLAVDWFLDRCRTTVNVWDDAVGAAIVARLAGIRDDANPDPVAAPASR